MHTVTLGTSDLQVSPICLGTMTFGEQVGTEAAHAILDHALARGIHFIDTAEMYAVPARRETFGATEEIIGQWFAKRPGVRRRVVLAPGWQGDVVLVATLQQHVRAQLAPYEYPKEIEFIDSLPMTTTGKVQRRVLRLQEEARAARVG